MYTSALELNKRFGSQLMIELASQAVNESVETNVFNAVINNADVSAFSASDVAIANKLLVTINDAIIRVAKKIDSYISERNDLPLLQADIDNSVIPDHAEAMVKYSLMIQGADDKSQKDNDDSMKWLRDVASGVAVIKHETQQSVNNSFNVKVAQGTSKFNWDAY